MGATVSRPVATVRGPVEPTSLGVTLAHEHLFVRTLDSERQWSEPFDDDLEVHRAATRLQAVVDVGVSSIFDPTVDGLGRDVALVARVNERVPELNIVVATGIYTWGDEPFYFRYRPTSEMAAAFVTDLTDGIRGSGGVRAGFIKCSVDEPGITRGLSRILKAAAHAHLETGAPLMVHTHPGTRNGLKVADNLQSAGVRAEAVVLAHSGDSTDPDHLEELARAGYFLGMDRFGPPPEGQLDHRIPIVGEMCRRGFAGSMMLSHDAACHIDWISPATLAGLPPSTYLYVDEVVMPELRTLGVDDSQVEAMRVKAPARWISGDA